MDIVFCIRGRLGNAIFRYLASVIMCINFNGHYKCNKSIYNNELSDAEFYHISQLLLNDKSVNALFNIQIVNGVSMSGFYQHDAIYKKFKPQILSYIEKNPTHSIITDGVNAGDGNIETFRMIDILNTPKEFSKIYKNVLHLRLEDFVTLQLYIPAKKIISLFEKDIIGSSETLCIVCKAPTTAFEKNYINEVQQFLEKEKNIKVIIESNDTLIDYYIMKEATNLICSKSTLSWCAAFFSTKINKCYMPTYEKSINMTCKYPTANEKVVFY